MVGSFVFSFSRKIGELIPNLMRKYVCGLNTNYMYYLCNLHFQRGTFK